MPYYVKETDTLIRGTLEIVAVCYPITHDPKTGGWRYSGEKSGAVFDESAEAILDNFGNEVFLGCDGEEYTFDEIEFREEQNT